MESPFKFFRKHQKQMLVFVFLSAMLAFTIGDPLMKLAGYARGGGGASQSVVETNAGKISNQDLEDLSRRKQIANQFIRIAATETGQPDPGNLFFGSPVESWLFRKEANRLGIQMDNTDVDNFLVRTFRRKLTTEILQDICQDLRQTPALIYEVLRDELAEQEAGQVLSPVNVTPSPEQLWRYYQQVHTRQSVEAVGVPVNAFIDNDSQPTDKEVAALFQKYNKRFDLRDSPQQKFGGDYKPGFRQPRKAQFQYVKLQFEEAEAAVAKARPVTDEEIQKYYDDNKAIDFTLQLPPEPTSEKGRKPGLSTPGEDDGDEKPKAPNEDDASVEKPESAERPEEPAAPAEETTPPAPTDEAKPEDKPEAPKEPDSASREPKADESALSTTCQDEPKPAADEPKPDAEPAGDAQPATEEKPASEEKPAADEANKSEETVPAEPGDDLPKLPDAPVSEDEMPAAEEDADVSPTAPPDPTKKSAAPIRYKPLDDELKEIIRDRLIRDRAKAYLKKKAKDISDAMFTEGQKLSQSVDRDKFDKADAKERQTLTEELQVKTVPAAADVLKALAEKHGGEFGETELLTPADLNDHPILGKTQEVPVSENSTTQPAGIVTVCFRSSGLYGALVVEDSAAAELAGNRYILWKVRELPDRIPTLDDPGVREQVVKAWRRIQAIPKARERAEAIAAAARKEESLEKAIADQTVTGAKDGAELAMVTSPEFSWFRASSAMSQFGREQLDLGNPVVLDGVGEKFMEAVFDKLEEKQIGVITNDDASIQYVIRVKERREANREAFKSAPLFGISIGKFQLPSQYQELANREAGRVRMGYGMELQKRYAVKYRDRETGALVEPTRDDELGGVGDDDSDDE
ncbi:MAG: SurA N-terminal domain-containing protein [Planctomycetota bacterium]|nr:SurA N-terminal domain-containing protein [Planctomycetota bacterium]